MFAFYAMVVQYNQLLTIGEKLAVGRLERLREILDSDGWPRNKDRFFEAMDIAVWGPRK